MRAMRAMRMTMLGLLAALAGACATAPDVAPKALTTVSDRAGSVPFPPPPPFAAWVSTRPRPSFVLPPTPPVRKPEVTGDADS